MKIVFFGTSPYSAQFLELLTSRHLKIDLVVSAPPKPVGRKKIITENPTIITAKKLSIPFVTSLKDSLLTNFLATKPTIGLMLDFNRFIPKSIIDLFSKGIINVHFSKLPQYRGPAPVQATILNGDKEAWISYFLITEKLDEGPLLAQTSLPLEGTENSEELYQKLVAKAAKEIPLIITDYLTNKITPRPQKNSPSYTEKLTLEKTKIDWSKSSQEIERLIRAANPEPGAWTEVSLQAPNSLPQIKKLKILKAHLEDHKLVLDIVQLEGKKPVTWKQFCEGYPNAQIKKQKY